MKKKLTCHCGGVEAEIEIPETGIEKLMRCNCTLCKRKGYIIGVLGENDFTLTKGKELLKLYQYYTNTAKHFFCSICGIHTHNNPRINPKIFGVNVKKINMIISKGKTKRFKGRVGKRKNEKKAIISLEKGQKIDITTGI